MARKPAPKEQTAATAPRPTNGAKQPVKMTDALFDEICVRIANGSMLMQLEKEEGGDRFPSRTTVLAWINAAPERLDQYDLARKHQSDYFADLLGGVNAQLLAGKIDPQSARALSDNLKWLAKVGRPERYGDRSQVDLNVSRTDAPETADDLRARILKTVGALPLIEANDAEN
jgi:hypothetical protein